MDYLLANSGCSGTGCESGWTLYLDNSFVSPPSYYNGNGFVGGGGGGGGGGGKSCGFGEEKRIILKKDVGAEEEGEGEEEEEEEEEDLSMVSDASSGPPQYFAEDQEDYVVANVDSNSCYYGYNEPVAAAFSKNTTAKIKKTKENRHRQVPSSLLDDTASSPVFNISSNNFPMDNNNHQSAENVLDFSQGYSTTHFEESSAYRHGFFHSSLSGNYLQKNQWFQGRR